MPFAFARRFAATVLLCCLLCFGIANVFAQQAPPPSPPPAYGAPITLTQARKVAAAAEAEALKNKWNVVIAIVDSGGNLVLLERMDDTQIFSIEIAQKKAKTANGMRRPSKVFDDGLANGGSSVRVLGIDALAPIEGGIPLIVDGKIIGAIGISGVTSQQDGQIAAAGVAALKAQ